MSAITNTAKTYDLKGIREDLSDVIYQISPEDTPYLSNAGRAGKIKSTFSEWQTDSLAAASSSNAQLEGDDVAVFDAVVPTVRLGNYTQIARKTLIISGTAESVDKAGRKSELAYQIAKKGSELKLDMETGLLANQGAVAGSANVPRQTASILAFVKTNTDKGATGVDPVYTNVPTAARTDGTIRAFTETLLKNVIVKGWQSGAHLKTIMLGATQKLAFSAFTGIATKTSQQTTAKMAAIIGAADVYVSDFGTLTVVPNRNMRNRDVLLLDWDFVGVSYLRPFQTVALAKTGDAEKRMMIVEYMHRVNNEAAVGIVADCS